MGREAENKRSGSGFTTSVNPHPMLNPTLKPTLKPTLNPEPQTMLSRTTNIGIIAYAHACLGLCLSIRWKLLVQTSGSSSTRTFPRMSSLASSW